MPFYKGEIQSSMLGTFKSKEVPERKTSSQFYLQNKNEQIRKKKRLNVQ